MTRAKDISKIITDADFSGTLDVTGTVTAGGLTVQDASAGRVLTGIFQNTTNAAGTSSGISLRNSANTTSVNLTAERVGSNAGADLVITGFDNAGVEKNFMRITEGNDISFYEDTGTTPKLFWDASVQALSVNESTIISGGTPQTTPSIQASDGGTAGAGFGVVSSNNEIAGQLRIAASSQNAVYLEADPSNQRADSWIGFRVDASEKARIDTSGNLLVGKTSPNVANVGFEAKSDGAHFMTRDGGEPLKINRKTSDGNLLAFAKDGSTVGSIGANGGDLYVVNAGGVGAGLKYNSGFPNIIPCNGTGDNRDNQIDLGASSIRFDDIYATNGTIQTSDQQEKNTITDSDLGIDFIKRLTPKSYIFNGKTRTHYGLIAQDVETVLTDINKPTSGFAGFIKTDISEEQDGSEYKYGLRYTEFVAPLIQAVKDQQATIDALTARITALENGE